ncbi:16S rRNA (cytosine(1402)-N(4))-methyltransferase RsmH [Azospira oryzae]|uniref:16S rRNA (cytosine(1402)-N(4))-methyltransferase RsmH n=1 Tax=Azospira oryzae TaxID=146939 RepID=UPI0019660575|nr:16S rRNA (cytosine(1402)-N(4))-methyltransferase RsmH [Azospira oryzae]
MTTERSTHVTVLLQEAVTALRVDPRGVYVDGTFGRGGHSRLILESLGPEGRLVAFDRDPRAIAAGAAIQDKRFSLHHTPFSEMGEVLQQQGIGLVDGVLLDIGVSSPQIDEGERGFSFRFDAPLDMRMDTTRGETAAEWLARADETEIAEVIRDYGEERFAKQIAKKIVAARSERPVATTRQLAALVAEAVRTREPGQDPATRSFQAIRIHINQELQELSLALSQALALLKPGGRLAVISFHSLEDRIVKNFLRDQAEPASHLPKGLPLRADQLPQPTLVLVGKAVRASREEVAANPRSRSAIMRVAERTAVPLSRKVA